MRKPREDETSFEQMGINAYKEGIKDSTDDPAFTMAIMANLDLFNITPADDWNQGWILAAYHFKQKAEEEAAEKEDSGD